VTTQLREGADASEELMTVAREVRADLIVMGHCGSGGVERFLLGNVANQVAHHAPCAVWVVRA
jgi:nucleotide-binding universal stress UspA family protein